MRPAGPATEGGVFALGIFQNSAVKQSTSRIFAAALMLAVSPATLAIAQTADSTQLDPLVVEAQKKKKKAAAAKKSAPKQAAAPAPQPVVQPQPEPQPPPPPISDAFPAGATFPGGNPYANPNAPYMVEQSANPKLTQPLADTPRTITAIPEAVMEDQGVRDLRELARNVPGLTIGSAEGGNAYGAFAIRGFKANNDIFVDSIRNPGNMIPDVFAVQQIEIYKGPSGGIAGRSTIGGAVNLISKQPDLNFNYYEVDTTIGTDSTFRSTLDANQVITHDFAVRANLMYDQHDIAGRDITDSERWGGLFSARARPTDDVMVTLDYYRYRNDAIPDWGVPVLTRTALAPADILPNAIHKPITEFGFSRDMFVGMVGLDFFEEQADIGTMMIVAKLADNITLTNTSRAGQSRVNYVATSMEGIPDVHHPNRDQMAQIYANQTELNVKFTTGTFKHNLVAGLEVTRENLDRDAYLVSNCCDTTRPFPPNVYSPTDVILGKSRTYDATIDDVGVYLLDTIHLSEQWIINGGVRFDDFSRDQVGGPNNGLTPAAAALNERLNTAKVEADLFSWNAGIVYKPVEIGSIYAAYGTSESPIGSELDSTGAQYNGLSSILVNAPPQEARAVEVGTKWELFDRRLLATAALFQTDVENARTNAAPTNPNVNDPNPPIDPLLFYSGEYRVRGIELGAAGNITKEWSVFGGLVLLDTEVLKSDPLNPQDVGRRLANIPLTQFALMSKYQLTDQLALGGTATYGGEVYAGHLAANASDNHTVDWWRFDAFAEYELTKNIELELIGLNLTDELYYDAIYQAPGLTGTGNGTFAFVAPGRAGYLTVKWKYD
jgi:catecholate siderophore receptor